MKKLILTLLTLVAIQTFSFAQKEVTTVDGGKVVPYEDGSWLFADSVRLYNVNTASLNQLEIPRTELMDIIVSHTGFSLLYNKTHNQANWIAYELTKEETEKIYNRTDKFIPDPLIKSGTADDKDYFGSGYDRGHLAPASDMGWSSTAMKESFYYSNVSPQESSFNRGIWKRLEELVRAWAIENNSIYVVTGPVLTNDLPSIGENMVSVPQYFYKVILDFNEPEIKGIGFIIPNIGSKEHLQSFAVTIDSVQKFTNIDFFPLLPEYQEKLVEEALCIACWTWKSHETPIRRNGKPKGLKP